ncbi:MAG: Rod shape-determining protein MreD [Bacteroidota bacterium]
MSSNRIISQVLAFFAYVLVQVLVFEDIGFLDRSFCFIYVSFLLLIPIETSVVILLLAGFVTGLSVDLFYNSIGIHASASVLVMYLRTIWLNSLTPQGGYDLGMTPTIKVMGITWFTVYSLPLIFIHHLVLFFVEVGGIKMVGFTLTKVIFSTLFTFIMVVITQYIFYQKKQRT